MATSLRKDQPRWNHLSIVNVFAFFCLFSFFFAPPPANCEGCGERNDDARIVGGSATGVNEVEKQRKASKPKSCWLLIWIPFPTVPLDGSSQLLQQILLRWVQWSSASSWNTQNTRTRIVCVNNLTRFTAWRSLWVESSGCAVAGDQHRLVLSILDYSSICVNAFNWLLQAFRYISRLNPNELLLSPLNVFCFHFYPLPRPFSSNRWNAD